MVLKNEKFIVERKPDFGGNAEFEKFEDLESAFAKEEVHPGDLKASVEFYLNRLLDPSCQEEIRDSGIEDFDI